MKYNLKLQTENWTDGYAQGDNLFQICDLIAIKQLTQEYYANKEVSQKQKDYLQKRIENYKKDYKESPWQRSDYDKYVDKQMYGTEE